MTLSKSLASREETPGPRGPGRGAAQTPTQEVDSPAAPHSDPAGDVGSGYGP